MKKSICTIIVLICSVLIISGCAQDKSNELVVGMELAYPPFETKDEYGNPAGVSVDFAKAFGEYARDFA